MPNLTAKEAAEALANGKLDKVLEGTRYKDAAYEYHVRDDGLTGTHPNDGMCAALADAPINAAKVQVLCLALAEAEGQAHQAIMQRIKLNQSSGMYDHNMGFAEATIAQALAGHRAKMEGE